MKETWVRAGLELTLRVAGLNYINIDTEIISKLIV